MRDAGLVALTIPFMNFDESIFSSSLTPIRLIVDADTGNEVDDLFAIVRAVIEPRLNIVGITSAQWHTQDRAPNNSVGESQRLNEEMLQLMGKSNIPHPEGSNIPLVNTHTAQPSDAADWIIQQAKETPDGEKLTISILGPSTNIASAILMDPTIIPKLKVCYIGLWHNPATQTWNKREFNTNNDPNALNLLMNTWNLDFHIMTASASQHLVFTKEEVDLHLKGKGGIADYLVERWETYDRFWQKNDKEKKRWIMWDIAIIEALAFPESAKESQFITPHDNLKRNIFAYTEIDVQKMKSQYWAAFKKFLK